MTSIATYARLVKFSHTIFAMPFALLAAFLAAASRQVGYWRRECFWTQLALVVLCMVAARSAAMAFNRIVDARFDAANPRTASRPLPAKQITLRQAWGFYALCCLLFLLACTAFWVLFANPWPLALAVPVLAILSLYSLTKRVTSLCHLVLGISLGIAPLAAWVAISPDTFGPAALVLGAAVVCWVAGFDIIYALQDIEIDRAQGLHSVPASLGPANALWISRALHLSAVTALLWVWRLGGPRLGSLYLLGVALAATVLLVEQMMVTPKNFSRVNAAFFACNGMVSLILGAAGIVDILL